VKRSVVTAALALTLVAAGCGSDTSESTTSVEQIQSFADQQLQLRLEQHQSVRAENQGRQNGELR